MYLQKLLLTSMTLTVASTLCATTTSTPTTGSPPSTSINTTPSQNTPPPPAPIPHPFKQLPKEAKPPMGEPFGMPGVVGYQNNRWSGSDYLGHLSDHIAIDVEILKGEGVPDVPSPAEIKGKIASILQSNEIIPNSSAEEGPPLPFIHILLFVYPTGNDTFVVFGAERLFEQIDVKRKNFQAAGYWQGITWETQNVILVPGNQLNAQMITLAETLTKEFVKRYRSYNPFNKPNEEKS